MEISLTVVLLLPEMMDVNVQGRRTIGFSGPHHHLGFSAALLDPIAWKSLKSPLEIESSDL